MRNKGLTGPSDCTQTGKCAGAREEGRFSIELNHHKWKRVGRRGEARVAKSKQKPGQGRGLKWGGDPGSASGQFLGHLL